MKRTGLRRDRETDQLLAGPLAPLARAAAAPAHEEELAGERAAVTAFLTAAPTRRRSVVRRVLTVKALIVLAAAGSTGVVLAATGGALPTPWTTPPQVTKTVPEPPPSKAVVPVDPTVDHPSSLPANPDGTTGNATPPGAAGQENEKSDRPDEGREDRDEERDEDKGRDEEGADHGADHGVTPSEPPQVTTSKSKKPRPTREEEHKAPVGTPPGAATAVPPSGAEPPSPGD